MDFHENIIEKLKEMKSSIPNKVNGQVYTAPDAFFDRFPDEMLQIIQCGTAEKKFTQSIPYSLPDQYFDTFPEKLREKLLHIPADEEIKSLSPLLAGLRDKKTLELPAEDYFEKQSYDARPSKLIPLLPKNDYAEKQIRWMRWGAAAAVVCIFALGGGSFLTGSNSGTFDQSVQEALARIPDASIQEYLSNNMDDYEVYSNASDANFQISSKEKKLLNSISGKEVEDVLENQSY